MLAHTDLEWEKISVKDTQGHLSTEDVSVKKLSTF